MVLKKITSAIAGAAAIATLGCAAPKSQPPTLDEVLHELRQTEGRVIDGTRYHAIWNFLYGEGEYDKEWRLLKEGSNGEPAVLLQCKTNTEHGATHQYFTSCTLDILGRGGERPEQVCQAQTTNYPDTPLFSYYKERNPLDALKCRPNEPALAENPDS